MYLHWLTTLKMVIDEKSYTKAARSLFISQSALSQHIRQLERHFNSVLIKRDGMDLYLTEAGQVAYDFAEKMEIEYNDVLRQLKEIANRGSMQVTIVSTSAPLVHRIPPALKSLWETHPEVEVKTVLKSKRSIAEMIKERIADLGIEPELPLDESIVAVPLKSEPIIGIAAAAHPLANKRSITASEVAEHKVAIIGPESQYRGLVDGWFEARGTRLGNVHQVAGVEEIRGAVLRNVALGFVARYIVADDIAEGRLTELDISDFELSRTMYIVHLRELREPARWLRDILIETDTK